MFSARHLAIEEWKLKKETGELDKELEEEEKKEREEEEKRRKELLVSSQFFLVQ